ncbi:ribose transport ATP-binding protein rbsA [Burkholderia pseudomallei]|nr:ribose transport ATP-binding protein rbsA [Burkholderia pseudomallei]
MRRDCRAVLHTQFGLDLAPDRLIGELSVAEQQIVQITRALLGRHEILVFDEPSGCCGRSSGCAPTGTPSSMCRTTWTRSRAYATA